MTDNQNDTNQQDQQDQQDQHDQLPGGGKERPAIMNWVIIIIGVLVLAQAIALGVFWLAL